MWTFHPPPTVGKYLLTQIQMACATWKITVHLIIILIKRITTVIPQATFAIPMMMMILLMTPLITVRLTTIPAKKITTVMVLATFAILMMMMIPSRTLVITAPLIITLTNWILIARMVEML